MRKLLELIYQHAYITILLVILLTYLFTLHAKVGNFYPPLNTQENVNINEPPFESSQERARYSQTVSLVERHTFNINPYSNFSAPDLGWYNDKYYPAYPPGVSILAIPGYIIGRLIGQSIIFSFLTITFISIVSSFILLKSLELLRITKSIRILTVFLYAFSTNLWAYSISMSAHPVSAFVVILSFYSFLRIELTNEKAKYMIFLIMTLALCLWIDYPNILIIMPMIVLSIIKFFEIKKNDEFLSIEVPYKLIAFILVFLISSLPLLIFNQYHFKKPIAFTNQFNLQRLRIQNIPYDINHLSNSLFEKKSYSNRFDLLRLPKGSEILLIDIDRGLLFYSPLAFLALSSIIFYKKLKYKSIWIALYSSIFLCILIYATFDDPWGGWSFGPRYLIAVLPLISILIAIFIEQIVKIKNYYLMTLTYILGLVGIFINSLGAITTNANPPIPEVKNIWDASIYRNISLVTRGETSTVIYMEFFKKYLNLTQYLLLICAILFFIYTILYLNIIRNKK